MSDQSSDQIHPASPLRRQQAERDGDGPRSSEFANAVQTLLALAAILLLLGNVAAWMKSWTVSTWQDAADGTRLNSEATIANLQSTIFSVSWVLAPLLILILISGFLAAWCQTGVKFSPQRASFDVARINPARWLRDRVSLRAWSSLLLGIPKTMIAVAVAAWSCWVQRDAILMLGRIPVEQIGDSCFWLVLTVGAHVALAVFGLSMVDLFVQRWSFERRIRMTDQQLRDETRMQSGDPQVNAHRRSFHRTLTNR